MTTLMAHLPGRNLKITLGGRARQILWEGQQGKDVAFFAVWRRMGRLTSPSRRPPQRPAEYKSRLATTRESNEIYVP